MADRTFTLNSTEPDNAQQFRDPEQDVLSETSEESYEPHDNYRSFNYGYRSSNNSDGDADDDDEEDEEDPYRELFMNAYRSAPHSSDEEETEKDMTGCSNPAAKPLCLMEDWDLWDYMDESELKERLKDHPQLLEVITRKRKRRMLEEETETKTALEDDELCSVMNRAVKCIRTEPSQLTS